MLWTPFTIRMVLHFHTQPSEPFPQRSAPIYKQTLEWLVDMGIVAQGEDPMSTTEKGKALVEMWCNTPEPVKKYVDPRFD